MKATDITTCLDLCKVSYTEEYCPEGFYEVEDMRYGVKHVGDTTFIVFRGTANLSNWLRDARVFPTRSCGGYLAHKGFVRAYQKLCSKGLPIFTDGKAIVTGHSLGGAIATLYAEHTGSKLITFGSPRVYFRFGDAPTLDHFRVVCDDDPVPMVPKMFFAHRQDPSLIFKDKDNHIVEAKDHRIDVYQARWEVYQAATEMYNKELSYVGQN